MHEPMFLGKRRRLFQPVQCGARRMVGSSAPSPSRRRSPFVPGPEARSETRVIDAQIAIVSAHHRIRVDGRDLLRHDPDIGGVAPQIAVAIEIKTVTDLPDTRNVTPQRMAEALANVVVPASIANAAGAVYLAKRSTAALSFRSEDSCDCSAGLASRSRSSSMCHPQGRVDHA